MKDVLYILLVFVVFCLIAWFVEPFLLSLNSLQLPEGIEVGQWKTGFRNWSLFGVIFAGAMSVLWYFYAYKFKISDSQSAKGKESIWVLLLIISILSAIGVAVIFTIRLKIGNFLVYLFFLINGPLCYYISTLLFSPSSSQYIPWWSSQIRPLFRK